jgi:hypothetical protein
MKTVKILIATAILSTSFYACKKEEMNIQPGEVTLNSSNQSNISPEGTFDASSGMIKIVFNKVGTMIIEGNPNLEKLINMYDASKTAIAAAKEVFDITQQETLSITFDRNGNTISSSIPKVPVGSNYEIFLVNFCNILPKESISLNITKSTIQKNNKEYWDAMPQGIIESFQKGVLEVQNNLPQGYTFKVEIYPDNSNKILVLDENGNPQQQNGDIDCHSNFNSTAAIVSLYCWGQALMDWI